MRVALDKAKSEADQTAAALAQSQARETILAADVECKVCGQHLRPISHSSPSNSPS